MTRTTFRLSLALAASLLLHGLPFLTDLLPQPRSKPRPPPMVAELRPPPAPAPAQPELMLKEPAPSAPAEAPPKPRPRPPAAPAHPTPAKAGWQAEVQKQLKKLDEQGLFYPPEAIARGLQGEVLVLLILDEGGQVVAARVEQGSGHPLLDNAALRAVRSLRSLPADAPRETILPVRFRLQ